MTGVCWRAAYVSRALRHASSFCSKAPSEISISSHCVLEDPQRHSCRTCLESGVTELWSLIIASDANPALPQLSGRACIPGGDVVSRGREATEGGRMHRKEDAWDWGGPELASSLCPLTMLAAGEAYEPGLVCAGHGMEHYGEERMAAVAKHQGARASRAMLGLLTIPPQNPDKKLLLK